MENGQDKKERRGEDADKYATREKMGAMLQRKPDDLYSDAPAIAFPRGGSEHMLGLFEMTGDSEREMERISKESNKRVEQAGERGAAETQTQPDAGFKVEHVR